MNGINIYINVNISHLIKVNNINIFLTIYKLITF